MNRKIEFKGLDIESNEWHYGDLLQVVINNVPRKFIIPHGISCEKDTKIQVIQKEVKEETISQLWVIVDNIKYFEGDMISFKEFKYVTFILMYNDIKKCFSFVEKCEYNKLQLEDKLTTLNVLSNQGFANTEILEKYTPIIIGNIYENIELLNY